MDEAEEAALLALFQKIDVDGGGTLERDEIKELAVNLGANLSDLDLDDAMAQVRSKPTRLRWAPSPRDLLIVVRPQMDDDRSGEVDFGEFRSWWVKNKGDENNAWAAAVSSQVGSFEAAGAFMGMMASGNTDGSLATIEALLQQLPPGEQRAALNTTVHAAIENAIRKKHGVEVPLDSGPATAGISEEVWMAAIVKAQQGVIELMGGTPTKHVRPPHVM
jgi:hypothetical protein